MMFFICTQQHGLECLLCQLLSKGVQTELSKRKCRVYFLVLLECLQGVASIAILFLLHLQHLQIQFVLANQFGLEKNFQDLIGDGKGEGSFFFNYAGPDC